MEIAEPSRTTEFHAQGGAQPLNSLGPAILCPPSKCTLVGRCHDPANYLFSSIPAPPHLDPVQGEKPISALRFLFAAVFPSPGRGPVN